MGALRWPDTLGPPKFGRRKIEPSQRRLRRFLPGFLFFLPSESAPFPQRGGFFGAFVQLRRSFLDMLMKWILQGDETLLTSRST